MTQRFLPKLPALLASLVALHLVACAVSPNYKPHRQNVPMLSEVGQARLGVYASRGVGFHAALSPFNHVGLTFQTNTYGAGELFGNSESNWMTQLGVGTFTPGPWDLLYESYLLGGFGRISADSGGLFEEDPSPLSARTWLLAVQPAIGYKHEVFEVALSGRTGYLGFWNVHGQSIQDSLDVRSYLRQHARTLIFEPAVTVRYFSKYFGVETQFGWSTSLSRPGLRQENYWGSLSFVWRVPGVEAPPGWTD